MLSRTARWKATSIVEFVNGHAAFRLPLVHWMMLHRPKLVVSMHSELHVSTEGGI